MNEDNVIEVCEEDEVIPACSEIETGALGTAPDTGTEDGLARHFLREEKGNFLWVHDNGPKGALAAWVESRWTTDDAGYRVLDGKISDFCNRMFREMPVSTDKKKADYRRKFLESRFQIGMRHIILGQLGQPGETCVPLAKFDADPLILGIPPRQEGTQKIGRVVDLRLATVRDVTRSEYVSKNIDIVPDFDMPTPLWWKTLLDTMSGEQDRADFLDRCFGYSLTAMVREEVWFILGSPTSSREDERGRGGKGTLVETAVNILGDHVFAVTLNYDQVMTSKNTHADLKRTYGEIHGMRFVVVGEAQEGSGHRINQAMIKSLTGKDRAPGAKLWKDITSPKPTWKFWTHLNFSPTLERTSAMRDRVLFIEFRERFTKENGRVNPRLKEQLEAEYPGILARWIRAAADWYRNGLQVPESITRASARLFEDTDYEKRFVTERLLHTGDHDSDFIGDKEMAEALKVFVDGVGEPGAYAKASKLGPHLEKLRAKHIRRGPRGAQSWGWTGVKLA